MNFITEVSCADGVSLKATCEADAVERTWEGRLHIKGEHTVTSYAHKSGSVMLAMVPAGNFRLWEAVPSTLA